MVKVLEELKKNNYSNHTIRKAIRQQQTLKYEMVKYETRDNDSCHTSQDPCA